MNTRKSTFVITMCFLMVMATALLAQNKTIVTVGGSYWNAGYTWEDDKGNQLAKLDPGNNFGPYLSISRNKWNMGLSYMTGKYPIKQSDVGGQIVSMNVDMTRGDLNFTVGYRVHPMVNIFAGVKHLRWSLKYSASILDQWLTTQDYSIEDVFSGPLFGGGASITIPFGTGGLYGFGSLAALGGTIKETYKGYDYLGDPQKSEADYSTALAALNLGVGFRFPSGFGITGGWRGDYITQQPADTATNVKENVRVQGVILTVSYSFK
jgi:hypothetical protein